MTRTATVASGCRFVAVLSITLLTFGVAAGEEAVERALTMPDQKVLPGQNGVWFPVMFSSDAPLQGFQIFATYDAEILSLVTHSIDFTVAAQVAPEFVSVNNSETFVKVGVIVDFLPPFTRRHVPPHDGRRLFHLVFDVLPEAKPGTVTEVKLENNPELSRVLNIFTIDGFSVFPELQSCRVEIAPPAEASKLFLRGDSDANGRLNINDALVTLNFLFQGDPRPQCMDAADVTDVGEVTLNSAISLLGFLFLGDRVPAIPFPTRGLDPTPDALPCP